MISVNICWSVPAAVVNSVRQVCFLSYILFLHAAFEFVYVFIFDIHSFIHLSPCFSYGSGLSWSWSQLEPGKRAHLAQVPLLQGNMKDRHPFTRSHHVFGHCSFFVIILFVSYDIFSYSGASHILDDITSRLSPSHHAPSNALLHLSSNPGCLYILSDIIIHVSMYVYFIQMVHNLLS